MRKHLKHLTALLLVLTFLFSAFPAAVSADESADSVKVVDVQYFDFHTQSQSAYLNDTLYSINKYAEGRKDFSAPLPLILDFSGDGITAASTYNLQKSYTLDFSDPEEIFVRRAKGQKYEYYNTYAGEHFYWRIASSQDNIEESPIHEVYITSEAPRNLLIYGAVNVRDIGGYKSSLGKDAYIRQGLYFRGARTDQLLEMGKIQMYDLGIRVDIDIRLESLDPEVKFGPYVDGIEYHYIPIDYRVNRFEECAAEFKEIYELIANAAEKPVYLHCNAGADRTGTVSMMLLAVLGVGFEDIARDYAFTSFANFGMRELGGEFDTQYLRLGEFEGDTKAEQAANWMKSKGISDETIEKLRTTFIENYDPDYEPESELTPSSWAQEEVNLATEIGLAPLELRTGFKDPITRGDISGALVNLITKCTGFRIDSLLQKNGAAINEEMFSDTKDNNILSAAALGIINGVGGGKFNPNGTLTRAQIAALINRVANVLGIETDGYTHNFTDMTDNNKWVDSELGWPSSVGIINGVSSTKFNPGGTLTKEQALRIIYRAYKVFGEIVHTRIDYTVSETPAADSGSYLTDFIDAEIIDSYITFDEAKTESDIGSLELKYNGEVSEEDGYFGKSAEFNKGYISLGDGFNPDKESFTLSFWINSDKISGDPAIISNKDWDSGDNAGFIFAIRENDVKFNLGDGENRMDESWYIPADFFDGWVHLILIVDRENGQIGLSFDFGESDMRQMTDELKDATFLSEFGVNLGQDGTGAYGDELKADIDELIIFNKALTSEEISSLASYYGRY